MMPSMSLPSPPPLSPASVDTASVPMKLNMMVINAPTTTDRPLGAKPLSGTRGTTAA